MVVDILYKRAQFIPMKSSQIAAKDVAEPFYREVFKHHGFPRKIISGRDSRFTASLGTQLMKWPQIRLIFSAVFHPQTDGQSERAFRTFQDMLRYFVNNAQNDWTAIYQDRSLHIAIVRT